MAVQASGYAAEVYVGRQVRDVELKQFEVQLPGMYTGCKLDYPHFP